jgi:DNA-binding NtrC family response regulator
MAMERPLPQWSRPDDGAEFYLALFPREDVSALDRIVQVVLARRAAFVERWRHLHESRFGIHRECSYEAFQATYLPLLRSAVLRLAGGDITGFVTFGALLGAQLADAGVPFAVMVAQLSLLKESALYVLAMEPGGLDQALIFTVDKLLACGVTAAADGYYRTLHAPPRPNGAANAAGVLSTEPGAPTPWLFAGMIGRSEMMQRVFDHVRRLAASATPVLVVGETGTGKELVAHAIHACGPRRGGPLVAVNCAALPRDLIESEVFGYKRGAFSGALSEHLGLVRGAAGGTLLLDEVTEMGPELQAKLLRVIQERTVRPLGSVAEVPVDVRIVATTNRDPDAAVAAGVLRADLYYRLSAGKVVVPPLRERRDDIVPLVEYQMAALNARFPERAEGVCGITGDALVALLRYPWPGNVRELLNVLENAFLGARAQHIRVGDLGLPLPSEVRPLGGASGDVVTLREGERVLIERALRASGGNKRLASRLLGISRKKLYARIAKYALPSADDVDGG